MCNEPFSVIDLSNKFQLGSVQDKVDYVCKNVIYWGRISCYQVVSLHRYSVLPVTHYKIHFFVEGLST